MSGSSDHSVRMWDIVLGKCERTLRGHSDWVYSLDVQGNHVYSASWDGSVRVYHSPSSLPSSRFLHPPSHSYPSQLSITCFRSGRLMIRHSRSLRLAPQGPSAWPPLPRRLPKVLLPLLASRPLALPPLLLPLLVMLPSPPLLLLPLPLLHLRPKSLSLRSSNILVTSCI